MSDVRRNPQRTVPGHAASPDRQAVRVVIAAAKYGHRLWMELAIGDHSGMSLVGKAASSQEAAEICERLQPDVAILDSDMQAIDGVRLGLLIHALAPATKIISWSDISDRDPEESATHAGADAHVSRLAGVSEFLVVVERASGGGARPADAIIANLRYPHRSSVRAYPALDWTRSPADHPNGAQKWAGRQWMATRADRE